MMPAVPDHHEVQRVADVVKLHAIPLREARHGTRFTLEGLHFRLKRADRNVVYRVHGRHGWFVKLPVNPASTAIVREAAGIAAAASLSTVMPGLCAQPYAIDVAVPFIVARAVDAQPLSWVLYRAALSPVLSARQRALAVFAQLGRGLALLHGVPVERQALAPATRVTEAIFSRRVHTLTGDDPLLAEAVAVLITPRAHQGNVIVHGNFRPDNVLVADDRVCLIDFENCGMGSPYEDLHILCAHCVLMDRLLPSIGGGARDLASAFLGGYGSCRSYDGSELAHYITLMIATFYIDTCRLGTRPQRMGGIPFRAESLRRLLRETLDGLARGTVHEGPLGLLPAPGRASSPPAKG